MSRANYRSDQTGSIISSNHVGNTGVNTVIIFKILIVSLIVFLIIGFIPGIQGVYDDISARLTLLSIITLVVTTYLNTVTTNKSNSTATVSQSFQLMDRCKSNMIQLINGSTSSCPDLINSLYFDFQKDNSVLPYYTDLPTIQGDNYMSVNVICNTLYQNVEDFVYSEEYTYVQKSQLLTHFASLFVSPIIQNHWSKNYSSYYIGTVLLINNIIYIVNHYTFKNSQELDTFFIMYGNSNTYANSYLYNSGAK